MPSRVKTAPRPALKSGFCSRSVTACVAVAREVGRVWEETGTGEGEGEGLLVLRVLVLVLVGVVM
jgi:hypothetical protein